MARDEQKYQDESTKAPVEQEKQPAPTAKVYAPDEVREPTFISDGVYEYKD